MWFDDPLTERESDTGSVVFDRDDPLPTPSALWDAFDLLTLAVHDAVEAVPKTPIERSFTSVTDHSEGERQVYSRPK